MPAAPRLSLVQKHMRKADPKTELQLLRVDLRTTTLVERATDLSALESWLAPDRDAARPAGPINPRPVEHARSDHRQESRLPITRQRMGRHHHRAWPLDADRVRRPRRVRARAYPHPHRRRPKPGAEARAAHGL